MFGMSKGEDALQHHFTSDVFVRRATRDPSALIIRILTENENLGSFLPSVKWGIEKDDVVKMEIYSREMHGFECTTANK